MSESTPAVLCTFPGCGNSKWAKGLCSAHYRQQRMGGSLLPLRQRMIPGVPCAAPECIRLSVKRGWCETHYQQARKGMIPGVVRYWGDSPKICVVCGARDWPANGRRRVCSANCQGRLAYHSGVAPPLQRECDSCGMLIDLTVRSAKSGYIKRSDTRLCDLCYGAHYTRHKTSPAVLAKRDGTDCKICGDPVDMALRAPDLFRASVDHVVPWAKGGTHDPENLQLSHLWCNQAKSDQLNFTLMVAGGG